VAILTAQGLEENELLRLAASVEKESEHPLAQAIVAAVAERKLILADVTGFDSPTGKGVVGTVKGRKLHLGNARFLRESGVETTALEARRGVCGRTVPQRFSSPSTARWPRCWRSPTP
jgi:P-type Cu+ transporter